MLYIYIYRVVLNYIIKSLNAALTERNNIYAICVKIITFLSLCFLYILKVSFSPSISSFSLCLTNSVSLLALSYL